MLLSFALLPSPFPNLSITNMHQKALHEPMTIDFWHLTKKNWKLFIFLNKLFWPGNSLATLGFNINHMTRFSHHKLLRYYNNFVFPAAPPCPLLCDSKKAAPIIGQRRGRERQDYWFILKIRKNLDSAFKTKI